jgi:hypothetical protein
VSGEKGAKLAPKEVRMGGSANRGVRRRQRGWFSLLEEVCVSSLYQATEITIK